MSNIFKKEVAAFDRFDTQTFVSSSNLIGILSKRNEFKEDLVRVFQIPEDGSEIFKVGNSKELIAALSRLDAQGEKIDIKKEIKNIHLQKLLEAEKALFEIFQIENDYILTKLNSDKLVAETAYSAKNDLLDIYNLSRFANYCRDKEYNDLIDSIKAYLQTKNKNNNQTLSLRLVHKFEDDRFYIRAITSAGGYKDFGLNFSVFVALVSLGRYVDKSKNEIYINKYVISESDLYVSFMLSNEWKLDKDLFLSIGLVLENDEIKRSAVSFNGICKLRYSNNKQQNTELFIKPKGLRKKQQSYEVDLLTYQHRGKVENVLDKVEELPSFIDMFIKQVSDDAHKIVSKKTPNDVKELIAQKVKNAKKPEFKIFKDEIYNRLMKTTVDNTFKLLELLGQVDTLFKDSDVVSQDFWRTKLYEALVEGK